MTDTDLTIACAKAFLERHGYFIQKDPRSEMITPTELYKLAGCNYSSTAFHNRLHHEDCPPYEAEYTEAGRERKGHKQVGGRMLKIRPNPALLTWLGQPAARGKIINISTAA